MPTSQPFTRDDLADLLARLAEMVRDGHAPRGALQWEPPRPSDKVTDEIHSMVFGAFRVGHEDLNGLPVETDVVRIGRFDVKPA